MSESLREFRWKIFQKHVLQNNWLKHKPLITADGRSPQTDFLCLLHETFEALYGGAAGGGKSEALFMAALMFVDIPNYNAIIFRRSFTDLCKPGALIDRSFQWLTGTGARWDGVNHTWIFPSNAKVAFGFLENDRDVYHHQSAEYQFLGFDELTQFTEFQYRYMISRARRLQGVNLPIRIRSATNPPNRLQTGEVHGTWVKQRFLVEGASRGRVFIPATLDDNPALDKEEYLKSLSNLDPVTRAQLRDGNWNMDFEGNVFKRGKFAIVKVVPAELRKARFWDKAATKPEKGKKPCYTVGLLLGEAQGRYYVLDVVRFQAGPADVEAQIKQTAQLDGYDVPVYIEQEPGSAGVDDIDYYQRQVLVGYNFHGVKTTGSKFERAGPAASAVDAGNFSLKEASWNTDFLDEVSAFPEGEFKDQVDALSGAFNQFRVVGSPEPAWVFGD